METVERILKEKGAAVLTTPGSTLVLAAVEAMCSARVGAMIVVEGGEPAGIFSERDLMVRVILAGRDPAKTQVREVMTAELICVDPETSAAEAMAIMTEKRCRHLPVVQSGRLRGIVSIGDLVRWQSRTQTFQIRTLTDYICGKYPA